MAKNNKVLFSCIIFCFMVSYSISIFMHNFLLTTVLKPLPTILAYIALKKMVFMAQDFKKAQNTFCDAFLVWIVIDFVGAAGELVSYHNNVDFNIIYNIEIVTYLIVRIMILISAVQLYFGLTKKYNKFQRIADMFTIICCVISTMWIIFFAINPSNSINLMLNLDFRRIFSEIYRLISMLLLGVLLISWFHFQYRLISIGQRLVLIGLAVMATMDLAMSFNNQLMDMTLTDILYKVAIILIALGGEFFDQYQRKGLFIQLSSETEQMGKSWRNIPYLFSYPIMVFFFVGIQPELVMFVFIFAFYFVACLYVKQLDITDRLLESEKNKNDQLKLYSNVLEQSRLSVVITDINGNIEYVNPYFTEVNGYTKEEVIGKNPSILKSGKMLGSTYENLWENLTKGKKWIGEFINVGKYGNEYEERAIISPIVGDDDVVKHFVAIKENITESRKMKHLIDNQSNFIVQLSDIIPSSIFYVSKDDIFMGANEEFRNAYEIDTTLYHGTKFAETPWMTPYKLQVFEEMKAESIRTHAAVKRQIVREAAEKETAVLYSVNAYYSTEGDIGGYIGMMTDISELKDKEAELQNAIVLANAATEAKSLFLANMSHEIRTPMNAVIGMSYLALKTELTEKQRDYLLKINNAASSLLGIINDILDFSKIEAGKVEMESVDFKLDKVITDSIELLVQKAREKNLEFIYHLPCEIPSSLKGDPLRLGQVITNLVSNAVKFTPKGEIRVDITEEKREENQICLKFRIKDTGIGVMKESQKYLFDAFTQSDSSTTREYGGTGLGLAICSRLVKMMRGDIWVESELNQGSEFNFTAWFGIEVNTNEIPGRSFGAIKNLRTLIVDDNSASREILQEYMEYMGFKAEVAESGEQAIDMLIKRDGEEPYDLLFVDWKMPQLDGVATVKNISESSAINNKPSVVLVTAYDKEEMRNHAKGIHVDGFLTKPVTQSSLYDAIVNIFANNLALPDRRDIIENNYYLKGTKILLAEDNSVNQQIACELLEGQGVQVSIANNGIEAVEMYTKNVKKYDLILMDLQMPQMDGIDATKRIRELSKDIPIIAMTARTILEEKEKCFSVGMNDHISKPISPDALLATVAKWTKSKAKFNRVNENNTTERTLIPNIYGIDTQLGLKRVGKNVTLFKRLLKQFSIEQGNTIETIITAGEKDNFDQLEENIHLLKGVAGNIGASKIFESSEIVEKMLHRKATMEEIKPYIHKLLPEFELISNSISQLIIEEEQGNANEAVHESDRDQVIKKLIGLLDSGDIEAADYFYSNKLILKSIMESNNFENLVTKIETFDFEAAMDILQGLED